METLTKAAKVIAGGDYNARVEIKSRDEVEMLGEAFNSMVSDLAESHRSLADLNASLEQRVEQRTAELASRNRDMRLVLDNVEQGLITLGPDGVMSSERSAIVDKWFGTPDEGSAFVDYVSELDAAFGEWFAMSQEELKEGIMPTSVLLDQMPQRFTVAERIFKVSYIPMNEDGEDHAGLLLVIDDITARELLAQKEAEQRETHAPFRGHECRPDGVHVLYEGAGNLLSAIRRSKPDQMPDLKRITAYVEGQQWVYGL